MNLLTAPPEPAPMVRITDTWAKIPSLAPCACGAPAVVVHVSRLGRLPEEIEVFCLDCSPVVWVRGGER